jgi:flavin reductase (DIM6/NTAB) family NADH-FMN oxidoreductase RutF
MQVDIDKAIEIEEKLFGNCFENSEQIEGMKNFLEKGKKNKKSDEKKKNLQEAHKDQKQQQDNEMPKGELVPTDKFKNMIYLKEFTTPRMPAILSAGDKNSYNSMAIEWGSLGVAFRRPIFTVYVKPDRYTYEFMEKAKIFTVNIINKKIYKKFAIYGTKSGRDINKEEEAGTHIRFLDDGGITFDEAEEVYVCKIITKSYLKEENMDQSIFELYKSSPKVYKSLKPHTIYIGEIIGHYIRKN